MRRMTSLVLCVLLVRTGSALPRRGDPAVLIGLKTGTRLQVHSAGSPVGPGPWSAVDDRCRLLSVDAVQLACAADEDPQVRLVFPLAAVDAVYKVERHPPGFAAVFGSIMSGLLIGGLAASYPPVAAMGLVGLLITLVAAAQDHDPGWSGGWWSGGWWGGPPPPPPPAPERLVLVYHR